MIDRAEYVRSLVTIIESHDHSLRPSQMPSMAYMAAEWFLALIRGQGMSDQAVAYALKAFLTGGDELQQLVINSAADGIGWRGDTIGGFKTVIAENLKSNEVSAIAYKKEVLVAMRDIGVEI